MRRAAGISLEQVKQCANTAVACILPIGKSRIAASSSPEWPVKDDFFAWHDDLFRLAVKNHGLANVAKSFATCRRDVRKVSDLDRLRRGYF